MCDKRCKFKCVTTGYSEHCCAKCAHTDERVKEKVRLTNIKKFGVENPFQSENIKQKIKETCIVKYGCDHPMHCKEIIDKLQETNLKKYGNVCSLHGEDIAEKVRQTNLERYGVENGGGSKESLEKIKQTTLEKYGCEFYVQSQDYKNRYYSEVLPKLETTCEIKYGSKNFSNSQEYRNRQEEIVKKIFDIKKEHNTIGNLKTKVEEKFEKYLISNNIEYEYQYRSVVYPFNCDFYIFKYDLYIEIQGFWMHGKHPFIETNQDDITILNKWKEKSLTNPQYKTAINVWTVSDPLKRNTAKNHNLHWIEVFTNDVNDVIKSFINTVSKLK